MISLNCDISRGNTKFRNSGTFEIDDTGITEVIAKSLKGKGQKF